MQRFTQEIGRLLERRSQRPDFVLSGARQEDFLCRAKILKLGKRLVYGTAECVNGEGKLLTHHTITYIRAEPIATSSVVGYPRSHESYSRPTGIIRAPNRDRVL